MTTVLTPPTESTSDRFQPGPSDPFLARPTPAQPLAVVAPPEVRRTLRATRSRDVLPVLGAGTAALSLAGLIYFALAPFTGVLGYILLSFVLFVVVYAVLVGMDGTPTMVKDRVAAVVAHSLGFLMLLALVVVIAFVVQRGRSVLLYGNFYIRDMSVTGPLDPLSMGGIWHGIVGTLIIMAIALSVTIPLGITCAVFLAETRGAFTRFVRTIVEAMTALPSIIAGLFIYALITVGFGQLSGFAASMAIGIMMLPIIIRATDVVLRLVSGTLKEAAIALGAPRWRVVWHVVLPTARSGVMTAIILGTARGIGETSPVLLTSGFSASTNYNPFRGPMVSLPLQTFDFTKSPEASFVSRGFGTATVLLLLVLILFVIARIIGGRGPGDLSRRQQRRRATESLTDLARFEARRREVEQQEFAAATAGSTHSTTNSGAAFPPDGPSDPEEHVR